MKKQTTTAAPAPSTELVIITGLSGSGKATVLRTLEDLGYYAVDHLPVDLIPTGPEREETIVLRHPFEVAR